MCSNYIFPWPFFLSLKFSSVCLASSNLHVHLGLPAFVYWVLLSKCDFSLLAHIFFPLVPLGVRLLTCPEWCQGSKWWKTQPFLLSWAFGKARVWQIVIPSPFSTRGILRCSLATWDPSVLQCSSPLVHGGQLGGASPPRPHTAGGQKQPPPWEELGFHRGRVHLWEPGVPFYLVPKGALPFFPPLVLELWLWRVGPQTFSCPWSCRGSLWPLMLFPGFLVVSPREWVAGRGRGYALSAQSRQSQDSLEPSL